MTCRTGLGLLLVAAGLCAPGFALAQGAPEGPPADAPAGEPPDGAPEAGEEPAAEKPEQPPAATDPGAPVATPPAAAPPAAAPPVAAPPVAAPPVAAPPVAAPPVAAPPAGGTAPAVAAPVGQPAVQGGAAVGAAPGGDTTTTSDALPPRVPWAGTYLRWIHGVTTTALGVGRDNIGSEGEAYGQTFHARLNYKVVNQTHWGVSLRLDPILYVEITNSDTTTTERQPEFLDLPLSTLVTYKAYSSGLWSTTPGYVFGLSFPTSRASAANGTILQTSNRLLLTQNVPLLGQDAPVLKSVSFDGVVRWDHRFSKATTPVDDGLDRPRQNLVGGSFLDDQLGGGRFARDTLREVLSVSFSESLGGVPITLGADFLFSQQLKPEFDTSCVQIATGPVCVGDGADAPEELFYYGFGASLAVKPVPEASVTLSYGSSSSPLGQQQVSPDGDRQNFFYTPSAEFGLTVFFYPDALYERIATGTPRALAKRKSKRGAF